MKFPSIQKHENIARERNSFSRGYEKIANANQQFKIDFRDKVVLDIGSSTGGFTQYALEHGAKKVIAVEKGSRQMVEPTRSDARVELHEKTDFFKFWWKEPIDVVVADVSFVSIVSIMRHAIKGKVHCKTVWFLMVKPQFEARDDQLRRGVVKNEHMRRDILKGFEASAKEMGFLIRKKHDNELAGRMGNVERFYLLEFVKKV